MNIVESLTPSMASSIFLEPPEHSQNPSTKSDE